MNILEQYIKEILSEINIPIEETEKHGLKGQYVRVKAVTDCYGCISTNERTVLKSEWEEAKEKGYYMA